MKSIDLEHGVVPISQAASSLAALIKRSRTDQQPIIITQKGYPRGVLLGIELYTSLCQRAVPERPAESDPTAESDAP